MARKASRFGYLLALDPPNEATMLETGKTSIVITHAAAFIKKPKSSKQLRARAAATAWHYLPEDAVNAWRRYAGFFRRYSATKQKVMGPNARNLFIQATLARWELDVDLPAPASPPALPFPYEIGVVALRRRDQERAPTGFARFTATAPTQIGTLVEILVQDLANVNRRPKPTEFVPVGFVRFEENHLEVDIPLPDNLYATAYRVVDEVTLQSSPLQEAGIVAVGYVSRKRTRKRKPVSAKLPPVTPADTERLVNAAFVG